MRNRKVNRILIKNSFRTAMKNWSQLIGITVLVALFALILSLLSDISTRVVKGYENLNKISQLHDFISDQSSIDNISISDKAINNYINNNLNDKDKDSAKSEWKVVSAKNNSELSKQYIINLFSQEKNNDDFSWTRTESRTLTGVTYNNNGLTIKAISKTGSGENGSATSDKIFVSEGSDFSEDINSQREAIVSVNFARYYRLTPGTIIRLSKDEYGSSLVVRNEQKKWSSEDKASFNKLEKEARTNASKIDSSKFSVYQWYVIKGIGTSSDFSLPTIDDTTFIPNVKSQALIYVDPYSFGLSKFSFENKEDTNKRQFYEYNRVKSKLFVTSNKDREVSFSCKFNSPITNKDKYIKRFENNFNKLLGLQSTTRTFYSVDDSDYKYYSRVKIFDSVINAYTIFSRVILVIIATLTFITISLMTKKQIDAIRKQVGTLKALGYSKRKIIDNFLAASLITSIAGCLIGYLLSIPVEYLIVRIFGLYFSVYFSAFKFSILQFTYGLVGTYLINLIMVFISGYTILSQPALELLKGNVTKQISKVGLALKKIYVGKSFTTKLRAAIATSSVGKMFGVIIVMLTGSFLMSISIIAPKVLSDNKTASFNGVNYKSQYVYNSPIASNPFSFYKTFNYMSDNQKGAGSWGYDDLNKGNINLSYGLKAKDEGLTAYPLLGKKGSNQQIDWNKVIDSLRVGSQPADYYSFNVSSKATSLQNILSLQWRNISSKYLEDLDKQHYDENSVDTKVAISQMYSNWRDFSSIKETLNSSKDDKDSKIDLAESLIWFYKVYTNGISLKWNNAIAKPDANVEQYFSNTKDLYNINGVNISDKSAIVSEIKDLVDKKNNYDPMNISITNLNDNKSKPIGKIDIKNITHDVISFGNNAQLIINKLYAWMNACLLNKIGTAMLLTTYSSMPYYAQQNILDSIKNNRVYNISFGLIPFNPSSDEIGTALNTTYGENQSQIYVYGINSNTKQVNLKDTNDNKITNKLYQSDSNTVPIIINETMAKTTGKKIGDILDLNVKSKAYNYNKSDKDLTIDQFDGGWTSNDAISSLNSAGSVTASSKLYINKKAQSYSDGGFDAAGYKIDNQTSLSLGVSQADLSKAMNKSPNSEVAPTGVQKAYSKNELSINDVNTTKKFKIVGVQNGYGASQAWIANDNANKILNYDKTQKWMFYNYFVPEWFNNSFFNDKIITSDIKKIVQPVVDNLNGSYEDFVKTEMNSSISVFDQLLAKKSSSLYSFFNNQYPVFNYKCSLSNELVDITRGVSSWQQLGDYSVSGLTGGSYTETENIKNLKDVKKVLESMEQGAISSAYPLTVKKEILSQISSLVNIVLIMIIVITFIISIVIVMLVTNLIIYENKEFIATMKILGYSDKYSIWIIIRLYVTPLLVMFCIGFGLGWFAFAQILNYLASHSSWVMPLYMEWYIPIVILLVMIVIFTLTFTQAFSNIKRIKPLIVLQQ